MTENTAIAITMIALLGGIFFVVALRMWIDYKLDLAELEAKDE